MPGKRAWWEKYLKGTARFRGTPMPDVRRAVHAWYRDERLSSGSPEVQFDLAVALLSEPLTEDRLAGTLLLQEILLPAELFPWMDALPRFAAVFDAGHLSDWNSCDWFCVKVLGPMVERWGRPCAEAVVAWKDAPGLWRRRASGVAFVNLASRGDDNFPGFVELVLESCEATVLDDARFAQTGTGWVLRELSVADPVRVSEFIRVHRHRMSREALQSASRKLPRPS